MTLRFCAAGLTEIAKRINEAGIGHLPRFQESFVRLQICIGDFFNHFLGAGDDSSRGQNAYSQSVADDFYCTVPRSSALKPAAFTRRAQRSICVLILVMSCGLVSPETS